MSVKVRANHSRKHQPLSPHKLLSLEQTSINCIVTNLEQYPPHMLALLPLHFRRELLLLLPPADIFQLEQTKVVAGIDMENEIWKVVSERYDYKVACTAHIDENAPRRAYLYSLPVPLGIKPDSSSSPTLSSWKTRFVSCLISFLFYMKPFQISTDHSVMYEHYSSYLGYRNYIVFLQLLLCSQFLKLKQLTDVGGFPLQVSEVTLLPSRYSQLFTNFVSLSEWVQFLLEKCHIQPPNFIHVDLEQFDMESSTSQCFLNNVKHLQLSLDPDFILSEESILDNVMQLLDILKTSQQLECLSIVHSVSPSANNNVIITRRVFSQVLYNLFLHPSLVADNISCEHLALFRGLKHIDISGPLTGIELSTLCSLFVFTQNHNFKTISVTGSTVLHTTRQKENVLQALEHSFTFPMCSTCTSVFLDGIACIPFPFLFWLIKKFLYSPSTVPQKLVISSCPRIDYSVVPSEKELNSISEPPNLDNSHKSLHLLNITIDHTFLKALSNLPAVYLEELQLDYSPRPYYDCFRSQSNKVMPCDIIHKLTAIPVCRIKSLSFKLELLSSELDLSAFDANLYTALFEMARKYPESAVMLKLHSGFKPGYMESLFRRLYDEWKNSSGNTQLDQLFIHFSVSADEMPDFQSTCETILAECPINETAKHFDIISVRK